MIALNKLGLFIITLLVGSPKIDKNDGIDEIESPNSTNIEIIKKFFIMTIQVKKNSKLKAMIRDGKSKIIELFRPIKNIMR